MLDAIDADKSRWNNELVSSEGMRAPAYTGKRPGSHFTQFQALKMSLAADQSEFKMLGLAACALGMVDMIHEHPAGLSSLVSAPCGALCTAEAYGQADLRHAMHPNRDTMAAWVVKRREARHPEQERGRRHGQKDVLFGEDLVEGSEHLVEEHECTLGPDDETAEMATGGELQEVEPADVDELDAGKVAEHLDDVVVLLLAGVGHLGGVGVQRLKESNGLLGFGEGLGGGGNDERDLLDLLDAMAKGEDQRRQCRCSKRRNDRKAALVLVTTCARLCQKYSTLKKKMGAPGQQGGLCSNKDASEEAQLSLRHTYTTSCISPDPRVSAVPASQLSVRADDAPQALRAQSTSRQSLLMHSEGSDESERLASGRAGAPPVGSRALRTSTLRARALTYARRVRTTPRWCIRRLRAKRGWGWDIHIPSPPPARLAVSADAAPVAYGTLRLLRRTLSSARVGGDGHTARSAPAAICTRKADGTDMTEMARCPRRTGGGQCAQGMCTWMDAARRRLDVDVLAGREGWCSGGVDPPARAVAQLIGIDVVVGFDSRAPCLRPACRIRDRLPSSSAYRPERSCWRVLEMRCKFNARVSNLFLVRIATTSSSANAFSSFLSQCHTASCELGEHQKSEMNLGLGISYYPFPLPLGAGGKEVMARVLPCALSAGPARRGSVPPAASRTSSHVPPLLLHLRRMHLGVQEAIMSSSDKCSRFPTTPAADGIGGSRPPSHLPHTFQLLPSLHLIQWLHLFTMNIGRCPTPWNLLCGIMELVRSLPDVSDTSNVAN
ncbi:hypothetical protein FB451DRAFT_1181828 [Mycena latifolia]|nr:hypothetical protein FB451DRAFT_1181828 [Mycena latifolia]